MSVISQLPRSWKKVQMSEVCQLHYGKSLTASVRQPGNIPVYGSNGRTGWHNAALCEGPTIILGRKGQGPLGVKWVDEPFWVIDTAYYTTFSDSVYPKFLYFFTDMMGLNHLKDGTSNPSLTRDVFGIQHFPLPPLPEQRDIAAILGALDDKIEVNRKASATLEAMARALYRSWFVDFEPVWAKLEGRPPAHMDPTTAALFPDSFDDDGLPLGWTKSNVGEIFDVTMGQSPPGDTYNDLQIGIPFFQGRTDFGFRFPKNRKYCSAPTREAEAGSILLSVRAPVGDLNLALERCCIGRGVASLSEKRGRHSFGLYTMWSLSEALDAFQSEGTVFGSINRNQLLALEVATASPELVTAFNDLTSPMDAEIRRLELELRTLAALRDSLLPKLMSGEIRVGDARVQVEEVA